MAKPILPSRPLPSLARLRPARSVDLDETAEVTFRLRPRDEDTMSERLGGILDNLAGHLPHQRQHLTVEEWEERFGAREEDMEKVATFARRMGLKVKALRPGQRSVVVEGPLAKLQKALKVELENVHEDGETFRTHSSPVLVPDQLSETLEAVQGLDETPALFKRRPRIAERTKDNFEVRQVAELYDFPMQYTGKGQTVALLLLGGGFHQEDLDHYFSGIGLKTPQIEVLELFGAKNKPASNEAVQRFLKAQGFEPEPVDSDSLDTPEEDSVNNITWTIETTTDIEVVGAVVPDARIVVVFAPNTQDDQAAAMEHILGAEFREKYGLPTVVSCSWGQYEYRMRSDSLQAMESALAKAASLGVTVCFASGDFGGGPVYYPASSIYSLACGGTTILSAPTDRDVRECVWREGRMDLYFSASGGGASEKFAAPKWQHGAVAPFGVLKRGIPDISALAALATGYALIIGGAEVGMGGTSSAAPLLGGLVMQIIEANQDLKKGYRVGWLTPTIYEPSFEDAFINICKGDNGLYMATATGWDPCTGLGRPVGTKLLAALREEVKGSKAKAKT
ncbi:MAG: S53 family peptidase [Acidobacteriota bacterium]|nr:S53 family peptidase [Acidobacteriota bacterium]